MTFDTSPFLLKLANAIIILWNIVTIHFSCLLHYFAWSYYSQTYQVTNCGHLWFIIPPILYTRLCNLRFMLNHVEDQMNVDNSYINPVGVNHHRMNALTLSRFLRLKLPFSISPFLLNTHLLTTQKVLNW